MNLTGVKPGVYPFSLGGSQRLANRVAFMVDTLPECFEKEPNDEPLQAQSVTLPIIINGRIDKTDDWDVFRFIGRAGERVVAEVYARRLDSPLDSVIKLTDAQGRLLAFNDDWEDLSSGLNTHHADSYFLAKLPNDGVYFVHIGDTARHGGDEYSYRLRISAPRPDFALRVVPSAAGFIGKDSSSVSIYAIRKDGFDAPISIGLKGSPTNFSAQATTIYGNQPVGRLTIKSLSATAKQVLNLQLEGRAKVDNKEIVRDVVPAEDKMQAFLWRHLVPAGEFTVTAYPAGFQPPSKRTAPTVPASVIAAKRDSKGSEPAGKQFSKGQVVGRIRQLKRLYEDGLFTDAFYLDKVAECEAAR
jgi:hypothetical protein